MFRCLVRGLLIAGIAFIFTGCRESATPVPAPANIPSSSAIPAVTPASAPVSQPPNASAAVERTLEDAHMAYLAAYDRYVKMLRESGPQTMETLGALAEYQRKYQTYQLMIGNAKPSR
ncbi:hypothetical protein KBA41_11945 [Candidatus Ozemobacteraceae bacterium]|nr:hypothetical protein [Candidatus Ozemobacteraceae bacterium]